MRGDHESLKAKIRTHIGDTTVALAWPEGDFGQQWLPSLPGSARLNLDLCHRSFDLCFHQDGNGINVRF